MSDKRPNILYIMTDDHGTGALSCYGSQINHTPNMDRIAHGGMRLDNCYVTYSLCSPSRASILTGKYAHLHGKHQSVEISLTAHNRHSLAYYRTRDIKQQSSENGTCTAYQRALITTASCGTRALILTPDLSNPANTVLYGKKAGDIRQTS